MPAARQYAKVRVLTPDPSDHSVMPTVRRNEIKPKSYRVLR